MRLSRTVQSALAILVLLGVGFPAWFLWIGREGPSRPSARPERGPVPVTVEPVRPRDLELTLTAHGLLHPARRTPLAPEVGGRLVWVWPDWRRGVPVQEGQELLRVDPRPLEIQLDLAEAGVSEARAAVRRAGVEVRLADERRRRAEEERALALRELERVDTLAGDAALPESARDAAERGRVAADGALREATTALEAVRAAQQSAEAALEAARARRADVLDRLARCTLAAPYAGRLVGRPPALGTSLAPGVPVAELHDLSRLELVAYVPEERVAGLALGAPAEVRTQGLPGEVLDGVVAAVGAAADPATLSVPVEVDVRPDAERALGTAGVSAEVRLPLGTVPEAIWIDRRHFLWQDGEPVAWVLAEGRAVRRALTLGEPHGEGFRVRGGLAPGDLLVTHPIDRLEDGAPARPRAREGAPR